MSKACGSCSHFGIIEDEELGIGNCRVNPPRIVDVLLAVEFERNRVHSRSFNMYEAIDYATRYPLVGVEDYGCQEWADAQ